MVQTSYGWNLLSCSGPGKHLLGGLATQRTSVGHSGRLWSFCSVRESVLNFPNLISEHWRDLHDLITCKGTYLVDVIGDLY